MIEIRTFIGNAKSLMLATHNAETQANVYLNEVRGLVSVQASAQTLYSPDCDEEWFVHILTAVITTSADPFQLPLDWVEVGASS